MDDNTMIAIAVVIFGTLTFLYISMQEIFKFRLKKEQIKADALVKAEEIKAKNQLDIEALIHKDSINKNSNFSNANLAENDNEYLNERRNRLDEMA